MKKNSSILLAALLFLVTMVSSCEVVGGIFKAGMWVGILVVVLVVGIIIWIIGKARK